MYSEQGGVSPIATGVAGLVGGALIGAGVMAAKKLGEADAAKDDQTKLGV
jgi:hypothetical protein